jgi:hypothetical protein
MHTHKLNGFAGYNALQFTPPTPAHAVLSIYDQEGLAPLLRPLASGLESGKDARVMRFHK